MTRIVSDAAPTAALTIMTNVPAGWVNIHSRTLGGGVDVSLSTRGVIRRPGLRCPCVASSKSCTTSSVVSGLVYGSSGVVDSLPPDAPASGLVVPFRPICDVDPAELMFSVEFPGLADSLADTAGLVDSARVALASALVAGGAGVDGFATEGVTA